MLPTLPMELIELIVEQVSRSKERRQPLKALSLTCSALTPLCQQLLWERVIFHFDYDISSDLHRRSMLRARKIASNPQIGAYVRYFTFQVEEYAHLPRKIHVVTNAMTNMPNITKLNIICRRLTYDNPWPFDRFNRPLQVVLRTMLSGPKVESVTLCRISNLPVDVVAKVLVNVRNLDLRHCSFPASKPGEDHGSSAEDLVKITHSSLIELTCDLPSYQILQGVLGRWTEARSARVTFDSLKSIVLFMGIVGGSPSTQHSWLRNVSALQGLEITDLLGGPIAELRGTEIDDRPVHSILRKLNPSSHNTLTRLELDLHHECITNATDPYLGLCMANILPKLTRLRSIELSLCFKGPYNSTGSAHWDPNTILDHPGWRSPWGNLDRAASDLPELKSVLIWVTIKPWRGRGTVARRKNKAAAVNAREYVKENMEAAEFPYLCARRDSGEIDFYVEVHSDPEN